MALVAMCKGFKVTAMGCVKVSCYGQGFSAISLILSAARKGFFDHLALGCYLKGF